MVLKKLQAIVERLDLRDHYGLPWEVDDSKVGSIEQYLQYRDAIQKVRERGGIKETWFDPETPAKVRSVLESYRASGKRIRIYFGDAKTGRDWLDEDNVLGCVGRSGGLFKTPLIIEEGGGGGPAILDHCIVKMQDATTGKVLYQHESYHQPEFVIQACQGVKGYTHEVLADGKVHARFKSLGKAAAWLGFMTGECRSL